jgi:co-chaperonin GroES (HSP10)
MLNGYTPTRSNVVLRAYEWPEKSAGGIYFPGSMQYSPNHGGKDPWRGFVMSVGVEAKQLKVGQIVRYQPNNYAAQTVTHDGVRYIFLDEILVYAIEDADEVPVRALKNRVVFLPDRLEEKYGKLYLPQKREEPLLYGTVVVAGEGTELVPGDKVILENKKTWQYFDGAGKRYILTDIDNLLGKFE